MSLPAPPFMVSTPKPPIRTLAKASPVKTSLFVVPVKFSIPINVFVASKLPKPSTIVAMPRAKFAFIAVNAPLKLTVSLPAPPSMVSAT